VQEAKMPERHQSDPEVTATFLGDMYARWTLDCLTEIAHTISDDYFSSPEFFQGNDAPDDIVDLWISYGTAKNFPNRDQRYTLAGSIFGASDGYSVKGATPPTDAFHQNRDVLFKACIAAQTATSADSREGLNQQVRQALLPFQSYLGGFPGKAARVAYDQIKAVSDTSFAMLRSNTVSSRFIGSHAPIADGWPIQTSDANGDKLISECASKFKTDKSGMPTDFPTLRALARAGKEALESIVQPKTDLDGLVSKTYSWAMFTGMYEPYARKM
jgi:hypothetical protein